MTPLESIKEFYGEETRTSDWYLVEQSTIDKFGEATGDMDWIHTDPERARREIPFGGTISFGFCMMSMMTYFCRQIMKPDYLCYALYVLNYCFDHLRLMSPVPVGKRIRCHIRLMNVEQLGNGRYLVKSEYQIEVEGNSSKPAMVAEWLFLLVFPE